LKTLHLTKKDFRLEWFSGSGKGGQHRNKHENCCRITHIESGISAIGTASKSRVENQKAAFSVLASRLMAAQDQGNVRRGSSDEVRKYHEPRNEVLDHASGLRQTYKRVVIHGDLGEMIEARKKACEMS